MDRLQEIKKALSMDNGFLEEIEWRKDVEWLIEEIERLDNYLYELGWSPYWRD